MNKKARLFFYISFLLLFFSCLCLSCSSVNGHNEKHGIETIPIAEPPFVYGEDEQLESKEIIEHEATTVNQPSVVDNKVNEVSQESYEELFSQNSDSPYIDHNESLWNDNESGSELSSSISDSITTGKEPIVLRFAETPVESSEEIVDFHDVDESVIEVVENDKQGVVEAEKESEFQSDGFVDIHVDTSEESLIDDSINTSREQDFEMLISRESDSHHTVLIITVVVLSFIVAVLYVIVIIRSKKKSADYSVSEDIELNDGAEGTSAGIIANKEHDEIPTQSSSAECSTVAADPTKESEEMESYKAGAIGSVDPPLIQKDSEFVEFCNNPEKETPYEKSQEEEPERPAQPDGSDNTAIQEGKDSEEPKDDSTTNNPYDTLLEEESGKEYSTASVEPPVFQIDSEFVEICNNPGKETSYEKSQEEESEKPTQPDRSDNTTIQEEKDAEGPNGDFSIEEPLGTLQMGASEDIFTPSEESRLVLKQIDDEFAEFEDPGASDSEIPKTTVYLGIDFGTSYSKLAYWVDTNNRGVIGLNGKYFIDTVVYINDKSISLANNGGGYSEIRYFKYEMIPGGKNGALFSNDMKNAIRRLTGTCQTVQFAKYCAIFYVANLLICCREQISRMFSNYQFVINMGIPVPDGVAKQRIFEEILYCAYRLFSGGELSTSMDYNSLAKLCNTYLRELGKEKIDAKYPLYVTSEVIAEADFLLHQETYGVGRYVVVDIGGGTADFAFVQKCAGTEMGAYDLIWYSIVPHGIETAKINPQYTKNLKQAYITFLSDSKVCLDSKYASDVTYILFGGGASDERARSVFSSASFAIDRSLVFNLKPDDRSFPVHHQIGHLNLSESNKKRLVIACQLSYPNRPEIAVMPPTAENLKAIKENKVKKRQNGKSYSDMLDERRKELYGN